MRAGSFRELSTQGGKDQVLEAGAAFLATSPAGHERGRITN